MASRDVIYLVKRGADVQVYKDSVSEPTLLLNSIKKTIDNAQTSKSPGGEFAGREWLDGIGGIKNQGANGWQVYKAEVKGSSVEIGLPSKDKNFPGIDQITLTASSSQPLVFVIQYDEGFSQDIKVDEKSVFNGKALGNDAPFYNKPQKICVSCSGGSNDYGVSLNDQELELYSGQLGEEMKLSSVVSNKILNTLNSTPESRFIIPSSSFSFAWDGIASAGKAHGAYSAPQSQDAFFPTHSFGNAADILVSISVAAMVREEVFTPVSPPGFLLTNNAMQESPINAQPLSFDGSPSYSPFNIPTTRQTRTEAFEGDFEPVRPFDFHILKVPIAKENKPKTGSVPIQKAVRPSLALSAVSSKQDDSNGIQPINAILPKSGKTGSNRHEVKPSPHNHIMVKSANMPQSRPQRLFWSSIVSKEQGKKEDKPEGAKKSSGQKGGANAALAKGKRATASSKGTTAPKNREIAKPEAKKNKIKAKTKNQAGHRISAAKARISTSKTAQKEKKKKQLSTHAHKKKEAKGRKKEKKPEANFTPIGTGGSSWLEDKKGRFDTLKQTFEQSRKLLAQNSKSGPPKKMVENIMGASPYAVLSQKRNAPPINRDYKLLWMMNDKKRMRKL